jgi:hypothetical protein
MNHVERDMYERFCPTADQVRVAVAMLDAMPAATVNVVFVGIALPGKIRGIWTEGQTVAYVPGFWLAHSRDDLDPYAYDVARRAADRAAGDRLTGPGVSAYAVIERDGTWVVFEGGHGRQH